MDKKNSFFIKTISFTEKFYAIYQIHYFIRMKKFLANNEQRHYNVLNVFIQIKSFAKHSHRTLQLENMPCHTDVHVLLCPHSVVYQLDNETVSWRVNNFAQNPMTNDLFSSKLCVEWNLLLATRENCCESTKKEENGRENCLNTRYQLHIFLVVNALLPTSLKIQCGILECIIVQNVCKQMCL